MQVETLKKKELPHNIVLDNILGSFHDIAITAVDLDLRIFYYNDHAEKLYGYPVDEAIGRTIMEIHTKEKEGRNRLKSVIEALKNYGEYCYEVEQESNGSRYFIEARLTGIRDRERKLTGFVMISRDITLHKDDEIDVRERTIELEKAHKELVILLEDMTQAKKELQDINDSLIEIDRLKSMFISNMSQELRTPLNSIIDFTGIILQGLSGDINTLQRKQLSIVKRSSAHMLGLINEIIDLGRIEAGKVELDIREFDLTKCIHFIRNIFEVSMNEKSLAMTIDAPDVFRVEGDEARIKQVLINLIANAVKFTSEGLINIIVTRNKWMAEIAVQDSGIGIKRSDMDLLFKPFSRIAQGSIAGEGNGLGLYISKKTARLLGGTIKVESYFEKGSRFIFILPLKQGGNAL